MAVLTMEFYSASLCRAVTFRAILPNDVPPQMRRAPHWDRPAKTLYLLHGYSGTSSDWMLNAPMAELAVKYNLNIIFPAGENGFYLDGVQTGRKYGTYVGQELVDYTRSVLGLSDRKEDTFIGGLSMGGFGAVHTALAWPETFAKAFTLSGALIIHNLKKLHPGEEDAVANYEYYKLVFGDLETAEQSPVNPEVLVEELLRAGRPLPGLYQAIGTEDFLYEENQIFRRFLEERKVPLVYREGPGTHDFVFWREHIEPAIRWLLEEKA